MKRLLYFSGLDDSYMTQWQVEHFVNELSCIGYELIFFNPFHFENDKERSQALSDELINGRYSIFLNCMGDEWFGPYCKRVIHSITIPKILICFDNLQDPYMHKRSYSLFDLVWITSNENLELIKKLGADKVIYMPYGTYYRKLDFKKSVVRSKIFIGSTYGARGRILNKLIMIGEDIKIFGPTSLKKHTARLSLLKSFLNLRRYLRTKIGRKMILSRFLASFKPVNEFLNNALKGSTSLSWSLLESEILNSKIVLNFLELRNTDLLKDPIIKIHLKFFEIPGFGGIQICKRNSEVQKMYHEGEEIFFYDTFDELKHILKKVDSMSSERIIEMKKKAYDRTISEHLWRYRFQELINNI